MLKFASSEDVKFILAAEAQKFNCVKIQFFVSLYALALL
jgi:hypothetical protein